MGIRVIATISDINIANVMVSAWSRNNCPATPCTNTSGKNTATVVRVDAITAIETSRAPLTAACRIVAPASRMRAMFSSTTIESSTTIPVASASPPSDMTLRLTPAWPMKKNVVIRDIGSDRKMMNVLRTSLRKKKMIRIARTPPINASLRTSWRELCIKMD